MRSFTHVPLGDHSGEWRNLADAQDSGSCVRKDVGVQVPPRPPSLTSAFAQLARGEAASWVLLANALLTPVVGLDVLGWAPQHGGSGALSGGAAPPPAAC